jgi:hypothetical protein
VNRATTTDGKRQQPAHLGRPGQALRTIPGHPAFALPRLGLHHPTAGHVSMTMKKTGLEKIKALKLAHSMKGAHSERFGKGTSETLDRREQRKLDQAKGLVPFACKLDSALADTLKTRAASHPEGMTGLLNELLLKGLEAFEAKSATR